MDRSDMLRYIRRDNAFNTGTSCILLPPKYQNSLVTKRTHDLFSWGEKKK